MKEVVSDYHRAVQAYNEVRALSFGYRTRSDPGWSEKVTRDDWLIRIEVALQAWCCCFFFFFFFFFTSYWVRELARACVSDKLYRRMKNKKKHK